MKNERLTDQKMPRAAIDLIRRQMALKKPTTTMRKKDAKTKKCGNYQMVVIYPEKVKMK